MEGEAPGIEENFPSAEMLTYLRTTERFVHASFPVAGKIKRDVLETEVFHFGYDFTPDLSGQARNIFGQYFDPRKIAVVAYAVLPEVSGAQNVFCFFHRLKFFCRDFLPVGDAAGQAREGGFVPGRKPFGLRKLPDFFLMQVVVV